MKRLAFLLLPLFVLAACENSIPTAIDGTDETATVVIAPIDPADPAPVATNVNLAVAKTIQLVVPNTTLVPASNTATHVTASGDSYTDTDEHTINAGCPTHFQDTDSDGVADALILHFDAAALFPYAEDQIPEEPVTVTLAVTFVDESTFDGEYLIQLVYNDPGRKGNGGKP